MATDYEKFYRNNRHGLGKPSKEIIDFFDQFEPTESKVLDVGCGQGRDTLFIARLGHSVTAIDLSPSGIRDLQKDAEAEDLPITARVIDIREYKSRYKFDVILIDRTLHMLSSDDRISVLKYLLTLSKRDGYLLIVDERSNIPSFKTTMDSSKWEWMSIFEKRGFLFLKRI